MNKLTLLAVFFTFGNCLDMVEIPQEVISSGKEKLEVLEEHTRLPKFSDCWTNALIHLKDGCKVLTDSTQSDLALHFTNCFLEMSGQEPLDCLNERTEALKRICMKEMPEKAFTAYTEFFTQTQNMCYFLMNQVWHRETENTINNLKANSQMISEKLAETSELQNDLLEKQNHVLQAQEKLILNARDISMYLNASKQTLHNLVTDVGESTLDHLLQKWVLGKYPAIDKIVYFGAFITLIMIATSISFASGARLYLILNLLVNFFVEWFLPSILVITGSNLQMKDEYTWMLRKIFIFNAALLFIFFLFKYENNFGKQLTVLKEIQSQNRRIMDEIVMIKMRSVREYSTRAESRTPPLSPKLGRESPQLYNLNKSREDYTPSPTKPSQLPILEEMEENDEGDDTIVPLRNYRSASRASTVSQSSTRYNLRRRSEIFSN